MAETFGTNGTKLGDYHVTGSGWDFILGDYYAVVALSELLLKARKVLIVLDDIYSVKSALRLTLPDSDKMRVVNF